ncbi:MAG: PIN domain-containing protein, partial [Cyanobacteria bacterium J06649_11]
MLYVLLDSNIWYYLIDAHHDGKEHFRKLKYWVKDEKVKLLVPQTIVDEWARGETKKYKELEASWKRFFSRAKVFFDVSSLNTPEKVKTLIENQLEDIREIFAHHSVIIPITDAVRIDAANMAVENKRPFGRKKNSMADAFIYLSFVDYLERNGIVGNCYFVSENHSDFSDERDKEVIHPDLKPKFDERGVTYVHKMDYAFHQLSERLPNLESYEQADRFEQEKSKLENALLSPGFFDDIDGVADSHLSGISLLDSAISKPNPSKAEITTSISLIQSNENYKDYFLQKIHHAIWFKILDKIGLFDYQHNPDRILTSSGGYQVPRWSSILYLEKLSEKIANGEEQQLVPNIIRIIEDLSTHPKDNFFTWYKVIGIVANLPASAVSMKLLDFIPVWFTTTDHDTLFQSSELCRKLLPKYLLDSSESEESKNKALKILEHVFKVTEKADFSAELENGKYRFPIHLSELKMALFDNNLISEVKRIQSGNLVLTIADSLEKVITRLPIRFEKEFSEPIKSLTISATKADMSVSVVSEGAVVFNHTLPNYYHLGEVQVARYLFDIILKEIKEVNPEELNAYIAEKVSYIFNYSTKLWIEDLSEVDRNGHFHSIGELLTGILVELLANPPKQRQTEYVSILSDFLNYKISYPPIIRRLALHAIRNNWSTIGEEVFLDLLRTENIQPFLIIYEYHREVFELLSKCSGDLLEPDKAIFQSIIERGPKSAKRAYSEQDIDIWKLRWYTALREDSFFQGSYSILSKKYGLSSDYFQPSPKVTIRSGDTSPFSSGELLSMDSAEIVSRIHAFIPKSSWDEPTVGGFATALQDAVSEEPQRFAAELSLFTDIPYLYSYHLVYGFMKAVKAQKEFDVNNVLSFCSQYISNLEDR